MGFLGSDTKPAAPVDGSAAYQMLSAGDYPGAWLVLESADETAPLDVLHNKALCLRAAGRREEALELSGLAFRRLTEGVPQRPYDPVCSALLRTTEGPLPMHPAMPATSPTYAGLVSRWLYVLCLRDAGDEEGAARAAVPLETLGLKPLQRDG